MANDTPLGDAPAREGRPLLWRGRLMLIPIRDRLHEQRIADAKAALQAAKTREKRLQRAAEMRELVKQRSACQVTRMERERGLS